MKTNQTAGQDELIRKLLNSAKRDARTDRRSDVRFPFFRPVSIHLDGHCYSAFTRDICDSSLGLLHSMELPQREVELSISNNAGQNCRLLAQIEWCEPRGEGWFISGGRFVQSDISA